MGRKAKKENGEIRQEKKLVLVMYEGMDYRIVRRDDFLRWRDCGEWTVLMESDSREELTFFCNSFIFEVTKVEKIKN